MRKSLTFRLWAGLGLILLTYAASGAVSLVAVSKARDAAMNALEVTAPTLMATERLDASVLRQHLLGRMYAFGGDESSLKALATERRAYDEDIAALEAIDNGFAASPEASRIATLYGQFAASLDDLVGLARAYASGKASADELMATLGPAEDSQQSLSLAIDAYLRTSMRSSFEGSLIRANRVSRTIVIALSALAAVTAAVAVLIGVLIQRGIRIPVASLSETIASIAGGDHSARASGIRIEEFKDLARNFDAMVERLDSAERELMLSYYEQRKILDAIPAGLVSIGPDYRLGPEYSRVAKELFGGVDLSGIPLDELLFPGDDDEGSPRRRELRRYLRQLFENVTAEADFLEEINPVSRLSFSDVEGEERTLGLSFERIYNASAVSGVLVSVRDMTETIRAERRLADERKSRRREADCIQSILTLGPLPLGDFIVDARKDIASIRASLREGESEGMRAGFRLLHGLKGSAGSLGLEAVAELAHEAETLLEELTTATPGDETEARLALGVALGRLGEELDAVEGLISRLRAALARLDEVSSGAGERDELAEFGKQLEALSRQLEASLSKSIAIVTDFRVRELPRAKELKNAIIHLVRNAADHGLEDSFERLFAKKDARGTIRVAIRPEEGDAGSIAIDVEDDGAGIDFGRVERKAREAGLIAGDGPFEEARLLPLLFKPAFSTRDDVSDISGRGVGLDLVKEAVRAAGGTVAVATRKGRGTRFRIRVPSRG